MADEERVGLENLSPPEGARQRRKRVGRGPGSGKGKTAGRGDKGQKARSGNSIPAWFEGGQMPLYRRIPKRGFTPPNRVEVQEVNLRDLERVEETELDPERLEELGLIDSADRPVKILGAGEVDRAFTLRAHAISSGAREAVEAAGGRVELIES